MKARAGMGTLSAYAVTLMVSSAQTTYRDSPTASLALGATVRVGSRWSKQGQMQWRKTTRGGLPGGPVVKNHLPMRVTRVQSSVWEDSTGCKAAKPMHHNS